MNSSLSFSSFSSDIPISDGERTPNQPVKYRVPGRPVKRTSQYNPASQECYFEFRELPHVMTQDGVQSSLIIVPNDYATAIMVTTRVQESNKHVETHYTLSWCDPSFVERGFVAPPDRTADFLRKIINFVQNSGQRFISEEWTIMVGEDDRDVLLNVLTNALKQLMPPRLTAQDKLTFTKKMMTSVIDKIDDLQHCIRKLENTFNAMVSHQDAELTELAAEIDGYLDKADHHAEK